MVDNENRQWGTGTPREGEREFLACSSRRGAPGGVWQRPWGGQGSWTVQDRTMVREEPPREQVPCRPAEGPPQVFR